MGFGRNSRGQLGFENLDDKDAVTPIEIAVPQEDEECAPA
jgi:hypothetical protein